MQSVSLGYVTVTTAGTPVSLSAALATLGLSAELKVHKLDFAPRMGNSGKVYAGLVGLNKTSGVNVLTQLYPLQTAVGVQDSYRVCAPAGQSNPVRVAS